MFDRREKAILWRSNENLAKIAFTFDELELFLLSFLLFDNWLRRHYLSHRKVAIDWSRKGLFKAEHRVA